MTLVAAGVTLVLVLGLLLSEDRKSRLGVWITKPLASLGFLATAVLAGAHHTPYGRAVLCALLFSFVGDVLLIPRGELAFRLGLLAFLLGHLAYAVGFVFFGGVQPGVTALALVVLGLGAVPVLRWLWPHVSRDMRGPVVAYCLVITVMVATAAGHAAQTGRLLVLAAASLFYVSDLAVARDQFVAPGFFNKTWGLPLYYGAQLLFALTVPRV